MSFIIDKIILIILSLFLLLMECTGREAVVIFLFGVLFVCINTLFENEHRKKIAASICVYAGISLFVPGLIFMVPGIIYDIFAYRLIVPAVFVFVALVYSFIAINVSMPAVAFLVIVTCIGILLRYKSEKLSELQQTVKKIRDDSVEKNMLLAEKNRHLIEKQNQDIYVATLRERNRIAREIHDNVGHIITRTLLQLGALMTVNKEKPLHGQLISVKENLDIAMNNIRESVHDLHDESIDMKHAIFEIADSLKENFIYNVDYDISNRLEKSYKYAIIGIVKEAVSNILKHSKNNKVDIILREHPSMYQVVVHDYSDVDRHNPGKCETADIKLWRGSGIGMQNMQDRVESLNGRMTVYRDYGFKIFVTLPKTDINISGGVDESINRRR